MSQSYVNEYPILPSRTCLDYYLVLEKSNSEKCNICSYIIGYNIIDHNLIGLTFKANIKKETETKGLNFKVNIKKEAETNNFKTYVNYPALNQEYKWDDIYRETDCDTITFNFIQTWKLKRERYKLNLLGTSVSRNEKEDVHTEHEATD